MKQRTGRIVAAMVGITLLGAGGGWWFVGRSGSTELEDWIRYYLQSSLQARLNPRVSFGKLDYRFPRTVTLSDVTLTSDAVPLISIKRIQLELGKVPRPHEPLVIERIELSSPAVRLVCNSTGELVGWSNLVRAAKNAVSSEPRAEMRLTDVLSIRQVTIHGGSLGYVPNDGGEEMTLGNIASRLDATGERHSTGWLAFSARLNREELADIALNGRINVNTGELAVEPLRVEASIDQARYHLFPPSFQKLLREHQVAGHMTLEVKGTIPLGDVGEREVHFVSDLSQLTFANAGRQIDVRQVRAQGDLTRERAEASLAGEILGGSIDAHIAQIPGESQTTEFSTTLRGLQLAQLAIFAPLSISRRLLDYQIEGRITGTGTGRIAGEQAALASLSASVGIEPFTFAVLDQAGACEHLKLTCDIRAASQVFELSTPRAVWNFRSSPIEGQDLNIRAESSPDGTKVRVNAKTLGGQLQASADSLPTNNQQMRVTARATGLRAEAISELAQAMHLLDPTIGAAGVVDGGLRGEWNIADWKSSDLTFDATLAQGRLRRAGDAVTVNSALFDGTLRDEQITLHARVAVEQAAIDASLRRTLAANQPVQISGKIETLSLSPVIAHFADGATRRLATARTFDARLNGDFRASIASRGEAFTLELDGKLEDAYWVFNGMRVPLDNTVLHLAASDRRMDINASMDALDGKVRVRASLDLLQDRPMRIDWDINGLRIEKAYALGRTAGSTPNRGRLSSSGTLAARLDRLPESLIGEGSVEVDHGKLIQSSILLSLASLVNPTALLASSDQDHGRLRFRVFPNHVAIDSFDVTGPSLAIRGEGRVYYDGRLDLLVRTSAQPALESTLGPVGSLLGSLGDRLVEIEVDGTLASPRSRIAPIDSGPQRRARFAADPGRPR